jgi:hypothetical protein
MVVKFLATLTVKESFVVVIGMHSALYRRLVNTPKEKLSLQGRAVKYKELSILTGDVCGIINK